MRLVFQRRDLLTVKRDNSVIAHAISVDTAMGAGVVVPIKKAHPNLKNECSKYSKVNSGNVIGTAFRFVDETGTVYNLFTKKHVVQKAGIGMTYEDYIKNLKDSLIDLRKQMVINGEHNLAMPQVGCGLDRCKWEDVEEVIIDTFKETDFIILVCLWGNNIKYPFGFEKWMQRLERIQ